MVKGILAFALAGVEEEEDEEDEAAFNLDIVLAVGVVPAVASEFVVMAAGF